MYEMIEIHRYFCRVAANLVCCLSEASCKRKVRESAPCKNAVNGFRFSYTYLYLCFYEYSIHYRRTNQNLQIFHNLLNCQSILLKKFINIISIQQFFLNSIIQYLHIGITIESCDLLSESAF